MAALEFHVHETVHAEQNRVGQTGADTERDCSGLIGPSAAARGGGTPDAQVQETLHGEMNECSLRVHLRVPS